MKPDYISENEFWDEWGVVQKSSGVLFDFSDVKTFLLHHVWTVVESGSYEDGRWYATPGFHYVNRIGYVLTTVPWEDEFRDAIYFMGSSAYNKHEGGDQ